MEFSGSIFLERGSISLKKWFVKHRRQVLASKDSRERQRLSLLSFTHPDEDAPCERIYCGWLFARNAETGEILKRPITLPYEGSDEDLTLKIIDFIVLMGYQYGYSIRIRLDTLREPTPESFPNTFEDF